MVNLFCKKVSSSGVGWDDVLPADIRVGWKKWLASLHLLQDFSVRRSCFEAQSIGVISHKLHTLEMRRAATGSCEGT